ncbi:MAG: response regulator [Bacteroidota bacterium]
MAELKSVILVEDDEFDAIMTLEALRQIPIANPLIHLETGADLLDFLDNNDRKSIAVIILDLNMPKIGGLEALRIMKERNYSETPVVVLTSSAQSPDIKEAYALGANSYITKPVQTQTFQSVVANIGLYWGILNKIPD